VLRAAIFLLLLGASARVQGQQRPINVGDHRLSLDCDGDAKHWGTVVLSAGGGRTEEDWAKVQPAVAKFARVCSYDRAGLGQSDKISGAPQTLDEIVGDLHALLKASGEKAPFVLVAHSVAGIYVRNFATKFPNEVAGFVFVDSSHEEQAVGMHRIDPKGSIQGSTLDETTARMGFFVQVDQRLEWRTQLPVIVLGHGKPYARIPPLTDDQWAAADRLWRGLQEDLAKRSPQGQFRLAERSGHFIQLDQPEIVIQAVRDIINTH
jgi:pimeloyl-ACP methyl ester carboxylesterase